MTLTIFTWFKDDTAWTLCAITTTVSPPTSSTTSDFQPLHKPFLLPPTPSPSHISRDSMFSKVVCQSFWRHQLASIASSASTAQPLGLRQDWIRFRSFLTEDVKIVADPSFIAWVLDHPVDQSPHPGTQRLSGRCEQWWYYPNYLAAFFRYCCISGDQFHPPTLYPVSEAMRQYAPKLHPFVTLVTKKNPRDAKNLEKILNPKYLERILFSPVAVPIRHNGGIFQDKFFVTYHDQIHF